MKSKSILLLVMIVMLVVSSAPVATVNAYRYLDLNDDRHEQAYFESYAYPILPQNITRVSVSLASIDADSHSFLPSLSADGRYVVFGSYASNLVVNDTNEWGDIFVYDRQNGKISRVSVASDGTQANDDSFAPSISSDGRYVVFNSFASNLVAGLGCRYGVYVHDRQNQETTCVSVASDGTPGNSISLTPSISAGGRYVAFTSHADNLVLGDTNGWEDIFVRDRQTGETSRVSVSSDGSQANASSFSPFISADGRYVAFESRANNLVADDTNGFIDIFIHDRESGETNCISMASDGTQANASSSSPFISADGRYVVFESDAYNLIPGDTIGFGSDIFIRDRESGQIAKISLAADGGQANGSSLSPSISADGGYVVFESWASNLIVGDTNGYSDIFIYNRQNDKITRIPNSPPGFNSNDRSSNPAISADGRVIAFSSYASNLVWFDTNGAMDVFVYESFSKLGPTDAEMGTSLSPTLSWQTSESAIAYEYCYSSTPGPCTNWNSVGKNTSVNLNGLAPNYTYYWQVRLFTTGNTLFEADAGNWWTFSTTADPVNTWPPYSPPEPASFGDTPATHWAWDWVERLYSAGITGGCGSGSYCPEEPVTRAQMSIFLLRGIHGSDYTPPLVGDSTGFSDVPVSYWASAWIKQFYAEGITGGCGSGVYCPDQSVTRAQMSIFLLRARHGWSYSPPAVDGSTGFGDVAADYWAAAWIKQLAAEGITGGCGNGNYCPEEPVTRAQMAVFLVRAFGLP